MFYYKDCGNLQATQETEKRRRLDTKGIYVKDYVMKARVCDLYVKMLEI
jgi:hypothetical protein